MALDFVTTPLSQLSDAELREVASDVHVLVMDPPVQSILRQRYLPGVVARHGRNPQASLDQLVRARSADPSELRAYAVSHVATGLTVGLASVQPELRLEKQHVPLPPVLTRQLDFVAREILVGKRVNVSAWVGTAVVGSQFEALREVLGDLRDMTPEQLWTREPVTSSVDIQCAIQQAGFEQVGHGRLDDEETSWRLPPPSYLYFEV